MWVLDQPKSRRTGLGWRASLGTFWVVLCLDVQFLFARNSFSARTSSLFSMQVEMNFRD